MWRIKRTIFILFAVVLSLQAIAGISAVATDLIVHNGESIQAAVDKATSGDTIIVEPGNYTENIEINTDNLVIMSRSENPDDTVVQGSGGFRIYANNVTIKGFSIKGTDASDAIIISDWMGNCTIENNKLSNCQNGVEIGLTGFGNIVSNNEIMECEEGIGLADCQETTIKDNYISHCNKGIVMSDSLINTIENNTITKSDLGVVFGGISDENTVINNKITLNRRGLDLSAGGHQNRIYNNDFNNSVNVNFGDCAESNNWNTTRTAGKNIINGSSIGGNCWATPAGDGFTQTHFDVSGCGIAKEPCSLDEKNCDYLPLISTEKPVNVLPVAELSTNTTNCTASKPAAITVEQVIEDNESTGNIGVGNNATREDNESTGEDTNGKA
ncbi:MAG: NosD domain-containing protein [Methanosarcina sp.]